MLAAPIPAEEAQRLALLTACNILYTPAEAAFDDVAQLAADLCGSEIALITLVDSDYQWFKARVGVEQVGTPRDLSFCGHCIVGRKPFVITDTHEDARFADNPLVTGEPFLRFYAGVPLLVDGLGVGAISVADRAPRTLTEKQLGSLQRLAQQISRELTLRRDLARTTGNVKTGTDELGVRPGDVVGGYRLERELGRGGAGVVFEAVAPDGVHVALKVLRPAWGTTHAQLERFAREARVLMKLTSPHVAQLYDVGNLDLDAGGLPFLVLEMLQGADLADILDAHGPVATADACTWIAAVCDAVADAHELGIVHRDLKPSNIFLARTGDDAALMPKILDFGIATTEHDVGAARITNDDIVLGSPGYMSPEQMMGAALDGRSDVWSIGVVLYELLTGKLPFPGASPFEIFAAAQARPALPMSVHVEGIPPALQALVSQCLRKKPEERSLGMRELGRELRAI